MYFDDFGELSIESYDEDYIDAPDYILEEDFYSPHGAFDDVFGNLPVESEWTLQFSFDTDNDADLMYLAALDF